MQRLRSFAPSHQLLQALTAERCQLSQAAGAVHQCTVVCICHAWQASQKVNGCLVHHRLFALCSSNLHRKTNAAG